MGMYNAFPNTDDIVTVVPALILYVAKPDMAIGPLRDAPKRAANWVGDRKSEITAKIRPSRNV